ncbi:DNase I-like protein [Marasmius fiardii PR-910]|nr:DNase I-like protein [Marasmius fiardii PR-910]
MDQLFSLLLCSSIVTTVTPTLVTDIQGPTWQSPLLGQQVTNVTGIVSAKASNGFFIYGEPTDDKRISNGLFIFSSAGANRVNAGDLVSIDGSVNEYRPTNSPNDLTSTQITLTLDSLNVVSSNHTVTPLILGKDRSPPTYHFSALDIGPDGVFSVPNNASLIDVLNAALEPEQYGLDFWETLEGQLVLVPNPTALGFPNRYGDFWVHGDWPVTGKNGRGGLSLTFGPEGIPDANPEAIIIGTPLDGTKNPEVAIGTNVSDIVGIVDFQFGFYRVRPLTAPTVTSTVTGGVEKSFITSYIDSCVLTAGDYNVENMAPNSAHLPTIANHIVNILNTPDIMFLQEIQDNSGPINDGVVSANLTLAALVDAIDDASREASRGDVRYEFTEIPPVDGKDGGQPGGNIRNAYLYRPEKLRLVEGAPVGGSLEPVEVIGRDGKPSLTLNPGRIDPENSAWEDARKPLVAEWEMTFSGSKVFTVNVHLTSKGGSSSLHGDARPPVNSPVEERTRQVESVSGFLRSILDKDPEANIIVSGDFNEFTQTRSVLSSLTDIMEEVDELAGVPLVERYTYVFDQNSQQLDHMFVSRGVGGREVEAEHLHVNNWSPSLDKRVSDHDPTLARIRVC